MDKSHQSCLPMFTEKTENRLNPFHFPEGTITTFERHVSSAADSGGSTWCAVRNENGEHAGIELFRLDGSDQSRAFSLEHVGKGAGRPAVCAGDTAVYVAWSECEGHAWSIKCA
ncbi:MAG: hypothetical protein SCM11_07380, partial [Bacillota bacterium]|nr:hypothetical protein [Bacillota bacterium]